MLLALVFGSSLVFGIAGLMERAGAHEAHRHNSTAARTGYAFPLPAPGSYRLPPIKAAGGGIVVDESARRHDLAKLLSGQATVLAFIYTRCGDICPTATFEMSRLQDLVSKDRQLAAQTQLITMSFDPEHDTPEIMREHAVHWRSTHPSAPKWVFLTAPDADALKPVLLAYNQTVTPKPDAAAGPLHHIFRAFLTDRQGLIRNIYSLDFFDPELVLNDLRTLLVEHGSSLPQPLLGEQRR